MTSTEAMKCKHLAAINLKCLHLKTKLKYGNPYVFKTGIDCPGFTPKDKKDENRIILFIMTLALTILASCGDSTSLKHITDKENGHQYIVATERYKYGFQIIHDPDCIKCKDTSKTEK